MKEQKDISKKYPLPKKFERLFPETSRYQEYKDRRWYREDDEEYEHFSPHLEIDKLWRRLSDLTTDSLGPDLLRCLFYNLETDNARIKEIQDLSRYLSKESKLCTALTRIRNFPRYTRDDFDETGGSPVPLNVLNEYESQIERVLSALENSPPRHPFFQKIKDEFLIERQAIAKTKRNANSHYTLRAELSAKVIKVKDDWKKRGYRLEVVINPSGSIIAGDEHRGNSSSLRIRKKRSMTLFGERIDTREIARGFKTGVEKMCKDNKLIFKPGEEVEIHALIRMEQEDVGKYSSTIFYRLKKEGKVVEQEVKSAGSGLFPLAYMLRREEERKIGEDIFPIAERISHYNDLFIDLHELGRHGQISRALLKKGATFPTISDNSAEQMIMKNMKCPLLTLIKEPREVVPNNVDLRNDHHFIITTGANRNGKTVYSIGIAQNYMLGQASFPVFADKNSRLYPRSSIVAKFSDNRGSLEEGTSRYSADCIELAKGLSEIIPNSLLILDEVGTGTAPSDAVQTLTNVFGLLARLKDVSIIANTHYYDLVEELKERFHQIATIAFNFSKQHKATYKATPGVATTSEGIIIANKSGLSKKDLEKILLKWEEKGIA